MAEVQDLLTSLVEVLTTNQYQIADVLKARLAALVEALESADSSRPGGIPYRAADAELLLGELDVGDVLEEFEQKWL